MNIEDTKKAIEVMQAYVDGGTVVNSSGQCFKITTTATPSWIWACGAKAYAIKPKPRVMYISDEDDVLLTSKEHDSGHYDKSRFTKFIEVTDES